MKLQKELNINKYRTILFDCDGVILNSNKIKSEAFFKVASEIYNDEIATHFLDYHQRNGGISRFKKFEHLITRIAEREMELDQTIYKTMLSKFSAEIKKRYFDCELTPRIQEIRLNSKASWGVVSGGFEDELSEVFRYKRIENLFNLGIHGSPRTKEEIIKNFFELGKIYKPILLIGDSYYDFLVARNFSIDFVFLSEWTEENNWMQWTKSEGVKTHRKVEDIF